jgi:hypothetical protein
VGAALRIELCCDIALCIVLLHLLAALFLSGSPLQSRLHLDLKRLFGRLLKLRSADAIDADMLQAAFDGAASPAVISISNLLSLPVP